MSILIEHKQLKEYLAIWRAGNRLSITEAGARLGVHRNLYRHWELGHCLPHGANLQRVMIELRLRIEEIYFG